VQSHVRGHAELAWLLACITGLGELRRMTQFKAKTAEGDATAGLLTYPVLQAADILLYRAERVPVGEDQRQHLELARTLAARFERRYGPVFPVPEAALPHLGARVMDLRQPTRKMSTSGGTPAGTLHLLDPPDVLRRKIARAVTDSGADVRRAPDRPGVSNLLSILSAARDEPVAALEDRLRGRGHAALKAEVADAVVALTEPIRRRFADLARDGFAAVDEVLREGAARAGAAAADTLARARLAVGLLPAR
jgi:tryptophanyl-tRNA synthetase